MIQNLNFKRAQKDDFDFAWRTYAEAVKPNISEFLGKDWSDDEQRSLFETIWHPENTLILISDNRPVGWMEHSETDDETIFEQFYIIPELRHQGIGSKLLQPILSDWKAKGKPITGTVLKNSPYKTFFEHLGFQVVGEDKITYLMKWSATE